jgi:hypothetical protein
MQLLLALDCPAYFGTGELNPQLYSKCGNLLNYALRGVYHATYR